MFILHKCRCYDRPFSWDKIYKAFLGWVFKPIECDNCGAKHKITMQGRFIFVSLAALPTLLCLTFFRFANCRARLLLLFIYSVLVSV